MTQQKVDREKACELRMSGKSLQDVADVFGVSRERIRQVTRHLPKPKVISKMLGRHRKMSLKALAQVKRILSYALDSTKTSAGIAKELGISNGTVNDILMVSDTLQYILPVSHTNMVNPFISTYWSKISSGTATVTVNFLQANDPTPANFVAIAKGKNLTAYTKTLTLSASGWTNISFVQDTAKFEGRYLMVKFITSATASVKGKLFNRARFNQY